MVGEAIAGLSAIKTAFDMTKALQNMHDAVARDRAVIELQKEILAAQSAQATLVQRVSDLEKEVTQFEQWAAQKKRYALTDYGGGTFAYELKADAAEGEPIHRICADCYQKGHKSILQFKFKTGEQQDKYRCHSCDHEFYFGVRHEKVFPSHYRRGSP